MSASNEDLKDDRVPACLQWTCDDVEQWIDSLGYPFYKDCFRSNEINGRRLISITASTLPKIGITDFEHIKAIAKNIRDLLTVEEPYWNRSISLPPRGNLGLPFIEGMYLERRSITGEKADALSYVKFLMTSDDTKWQPPLSNCCLMLSTS